MTYSSLKPSLHLRRLIIEIEQALICYYQLDSPPDAGSHLIETGLESRGCVLAEASDEQLAIGIHLHPEVRDQLEKAPISENLDSWLVLVEEVSHFHFLCQRAASGRVLSQLELEFQAEIDKFLLTINHFQPLSGINHIIHVLFGQATFSSDRYEKANELAARFCHRLLGHPLRHHRDLQCPRLRKFLAAFYRAPSAEKLLLPR